MRTIVAIYLFILSSVQGFTISPHGGSSAAVGRRITSTIYINGPSPVRAQLQLLFSDTTSTSDHTIDSKHNNENGNSSFQQEQHDGAVAVRAPLKYVGPYPCLALRFPQLATASQRQRNVTGVSLDFVLDTAANTNTIQQQVATELGLNVVGRALPGVGSAGVIAQGGDTYFLGDCQLEGQEPFTFMSELTASALPVASPAAAGLLSLAFLQVFGGGVEFSWGTTPSAVASDPALAPPPSVTFYGDKSLDAKSGVLQGKTKIPIRRVPVTQLPTVTVTINGVEMAALLDTGSPITVLNAQAAARAGIATKLPMTSHQKTTNNPFQAATNRLQEAQAAARGDVLTIMGLGGKPVNLIKSSTPVSVEMKGDKNSLVDFGSVPLFVGDLPGLAALNGLGVESPPAVVLGMDVLRQRPSMLLRAQDDEVWF